MGRFMNRATGVTFSVDDSKDDRAKSSGFQPAEDAAEGGPAKDQKTAAKKAAAPRSEK